MYHSISDDTEPGISPYYRVTTSPARFADQMQWLADTGHQGVTLTEGLAWLQSRSVGTKHADRGTLRPEAAQPAADVANPPFGLRTSDFERRPVVLTFDDGFRDFYTAAVPTLRKFGFRATMFLPTEFVGHGDSAFTRHSFRSRECLTWDEVRALRQAGAEFGSHTVSHPVLYDLSWPKIESELCNSKAELEARLGCAVTTFAYPYAYPEADASFTRRFEDLLQGAGYDCAVTTRIGRVCAADNPNALRRLPVNDADDAALFHAKLEGAYDWLSLPQRLAKLRRAGRRPVVAPVPAPPVASSSGSPQTSSLSSSSAPTPLPSRGSKNRQLPR